MTSQESRYPARIAHRGGNSRAALHRAIAAQVDWIEVDCWWHCGRLIAQHEQPLWPLPITYDNRRLRLALERPLLLPEVIEATARGPRLLLDFKGASERLSRAVVESLRRQEAVARVAICGQDWRLLEAAARLEPSIHVIYSFGSAGQILAWRRRPADAPPIRAASVAHWLLTAELMHEFAGAGIAIFAWTVNDSARARELVELGIAGITSDDLDLLAGLPVDSSERRTPNPTDYLPRPREQKE